MGTHAVIGVKHPDGGITGCYVHFDGATILPRMEEYLKTNTTTCLTLLLSRAQIAGGLRSFPPEGADDFLEDGEAYVVNAVNWNAYHLGANYSYLVDFETAQVTVDEERRWRR